MICKRKSSYWTLNSRGVKLSLDDNELDTLGHGLRSLEYLEDRVTQQSDSFSSIYGNLVHFPFHFQLKQARNEARNSQKRHKKAYAQEK